MRNEKTSQRFDLAVIIVNDWSLFEIGQPSLPAACRPPARFSCLLDHFELPPLRTRWR
jgi:hypothetical protein